MVILSSKVEGLLQAALEAQCSYFWILREEQYGSRIFRLNYAIIAGISVAIQKNTNLNHSDTVPWLIKIHKYFESI